jgi:hypothetical protein
MTSAARGGTNPAETGKPPRLSEVEPKAGPARLESPVLPRRADVEHIHQRPGRHFIQEDQSPALAELITAKAKP